MTDHELLSVLFSYTGGFFWGAFCMFMLFVCLCRGGYNMPDDDKKAQGSVFVTDLRTMYGAIREATDQNNRPSYTGVPEVKTNGGVADTHNED